MPAHLTAVAPRPSAPCARPVGLRLSAPGLVAFSLFEQEASRGAQALRLTHPPPQPAC